MATPIIQTDPNLERRRQLAMEMMARGRSTAPVQHWTQGANRILESLMGAYKAKQAETQQDRQRQLGQESLNLAMDELAMPNGGRQPMMTEIGTPMQLGIEEPTGSPMSRFAQVLAQNPYTQDYAAQLQLQQAMQQPQIQQQQRAREADLQAKKDFEKYKAELKQQYPKPESEFDKYLKMLQAQKSQADIDKAKRDAEAAEKAKSSETYNIQNAADLVSELKSHPGFKGIYGNWQGASPTFRQQSIDAESIRDQLLNVMTLAARGQIKGQGQITDSETLMLERAQSRLSNPQISDEDAAAEAEKVLDYLESLGAKRPSMQQDKEQGRRSGRSDLRKPDETLDIESLINKYAD